MPEDFSDSQDQDEPRGLRRALEEQATKAAEASARAAAAERKLAFAEAGINLSDPQAKYFVAGYDGEISAEAIKAEAAAAGFIGATTNVPSGELAEHQAAANLSAGGSTPDSTPYWDNPQYVAEINQARTKGEVDAVMDKWGSPRTSNIQ